MYLDRNKIVACICAAFSIPIMLSCAAKRDIDQLPSYRKSPVFTGVNYDGAKFNSTEMSGKIWIVDFIFTNCAEICPKMSDNVARLVEMTGGKTPIVSISVDPEHDTPSALKEYAMQYSGGNKDWRFINMPLDSVRNVSVNGFAVGNYDNPLEHSSRLILIDEKGDVRGYYDGMDSVAVNKLAALINNAAR